MHCLMAPKALYSPNLAWLVRRRVRHVVSPASEARDSYLHFARFAMPSRRFLRLHGPAVFKKPLLHKYAATMRPGGHPCGHGSSPAGPWIQNPPLERCQKNGQNVQISLALL